MKVDAIVLGAGMVGVSLACHLAARGRSVALVDRKAPGEETSFGNAGVIERSALLPVAFPRDLHFLMQVGLGRTPHAAYHWRALPGLSRWLLAYYRNSTPSGLERSARALFPLVDRSLDEHKALLEAAGALGFLQEAGWLRVYRDAASREAEEPELKLARELGVPYEEFGAEDALQLEPGLRPVFKSAILWPTTGTVSDPGAVTKAYADLAARRGAKVLRGDARSLERSGQGWSVRSADGEPIEAADAVLALGPWTPDVLKRFGIALPLAVKRGYHMHYSGHGLTRPVVDVDGGYVIAPMQSGIRLTTGIEFAERDAPATPVQIDRAEPYARELFPRLGLRREPASWLGRRPCFPDSLPVIGRAPGQPGLWLSFGHQHLGFTLGPVSGRLLAEMMTGEGLLTDPSPYRAERFLPNRSRHAGSAPANESAVAS